MSKKLNIDDVTRGAMAVIIAQALPKDEEGLTVKQTAQALGLSAAHLNQMRLQNKGPAFYIKDSRVFYKPSSIRAFIQSNTITIKSSRRVA